jgi:hypothetical protein
VRNPSPEIPSSVPGAVHIGRILAALMPVAASCAGAAAPMPGAAVPSRDPPVYRCGNLFSQTPCPDATTIEVRDPRSEDERRQGEDVAAREKRLAAMLEEERHARERPPAAPAHAKVQPVCVAASGPLAGKAVPCPARRARAKAKSKPPHERASEASMTIVRVPAPASPGPNLR